eukprot:CAMPEP_0204428570 /NCGR_PEP_ID=MMETSP0470-20130426/58106_1 /ASSEMBLY_ACC=CAM_ASM_000385 /TAXON_ID=2969 /ORGANISM="Oxyrrhis marina" /LENGTH=44 /DNA_ID= /DNA_START= /DNA_END= /DNA_ORIENTATION=
MDRRTNWAKRRKILGQTAGTDDPHSGRNMGDGGGSGGGGGGGGG